MIIFNDLFDGIAGPIYNSVPLVGTWDAVQSSALFVTDGVGSAGSSSPSENVFFTVYTAPVEAVKESLTVTTNVLCNGFAGTNGNRTFVCRVSPTTGFGGSSDVFCSFISMTKSGNSILRFLTFIGQGSSISFGGTLDISVVDLSEHKITVKAMAGVTQLLFDDALIYTLPAVTSASELNGTKYLSLRSNALSRYLDIKLETGELPIDFWQNLVGTVQQ